MTDSPSPAPTAELALEPAAAPTAKPRRRFWPLALAGLILIVLGALGYGAYLGQRQLASYSASLAAAQAQWHSEQAANQQALTELAERGAEQARRHQQQLDELRARLHESEQRVAFHGKRLRALSTTTRDDWLLAEAEYLLRLANQRVLIEKSPGTAAELLSQADAIVRDLEDPELFALRRAIASDLTALRLTERVDVEGIYLSLLALGERVDQLPLRPERDMLRAPNLTLVEAAGEAERGWWQRVRASFARFTGKLHDYYRVEFDSARPEPLLPPDAAQYLQQNLRLILERAQLALLREQGEIFRQSLEQAGQWLLRYYPQGDSVQKFQQQLQELQQRPIEQSLPDISGSLILLHEYIERQHKLGAAAAPLAPATSGDNTAEGAR